VLSKPGIERVGLAYESPVEGDLSDRVPVVLPLPAGLGLQLDRPGDGVLRQFLERQDLEGITEQRLISAGVKNVTAA
jgi:hypothetical protein